MSVPFFKSRSEVGEIFIVSRDDVFFNPVFSFFVDVFFSLFDSGVTELNYSLVKLPTKYTLALLQLVCGDCRGDCRLPHNEVKRA